MTSTRRRPEDPDDAGFILQRKRFRVTKPSSQQSGATAAEQTIPVWRVVRHDDFPSPYQLVRWLECELGRPQGGVSAPGEFLPRGGTRTPPPPSRKGAMAQPGAFLFGKEGAQQERCPWGYPTGLPLDPVLETRSSCRRCGAVRGRAFKNAPPDPAGFS
ncbi:hypothetical protein GWK47_009432 [Chionoecetes opilio]|uniref:Uncharacterized protein n=1 Tax=Chionoecetes opilio TaxID=41210 RepID=A0A8J4Y4C8_CHIOP|nr:hypothetical protein GWK47_009432 [Chionoecetes opilio]